MQDCPLQGRPPTFRLRRMTVSTLTRRRSESGKRSSAIGFPARHTTKPRSLRRCNTSRLKPDLAADTLTQRCLIVHLLNIHKPREMSHDAPISRAWNVAILGVSPQQWQTVMTSPSGLALSVSMKPAPRLAQLRIRALTANVSCPAVWRS